MIHRQKRFSELKYIYPDALNEKAKRLEPRKIGKYRACGLRRSFVVYRAYTLFRAIYRHLCEYVTFRGVGKM